jgi:lysophospholipase L1-like esterase
VWPDFLMRNYYNGGYRTISHSVAGQSIMANMDTQTAAAATDDASIIIIALGTNDADDAGITAVYQNDINALKASNPHAKIYGMGILDKTTPGARINNNTRIQTACSNAGIPYWNTTGWIVPATDTADGTHPNLLGWNKIYPQVIALLP